MKKEFKYVSGVRIIFIGDVLDLHKIGHDHITLQARSSDKIRTLPLQAGSTQWSIQERETKSGVEYTANFSASFKVDGQQNRHTSRIEPVLVILDFCGQPSRLVGSQYLPVELRSYIDQHKQTVDFNHSSYQYPPLVTIQE